MAIRKDPQMRAINTAIARDPSGYSRVPRETFQEVFDRMERELQQKQVDWSTVVEYFTKRGRPLTKDEIQKLIDEDRKVREAEENKRRAEEEAERRRDQRIKGELQEEDFEAFQGKNKTDDEKTKGSGAEHEQSPGEDYDRAEGVNLDTEGGFENHLHSGDEAELENLTRTKLTE